MSFWDKMKDIASLQKERLEIELKASKRKPPFINEMPYEKKYTSEDIERINRINEKTIAVISPSAAEKVKKVNEKTENINRTWENFVDANNPLNASIRLITNRNELTSGDHLYVQRVGYTHHGLYLGNQQVIHYLLEEGVTIDSLDTFARGANIHIKDSPANYSREVIVERAYTRLGEMDYNLAHNNCENFVRWCRSGR